MMKLERIDKDLSFSEDLLNKIESLSSNQDNKKAVLSQLKKEYKALAKEVKSLVKVNITTTRGSYKVKEDEVEQEYQDNLSDLSNSSEATKEVLNGIKIKRKRALKTLVKNRLQDELDCKKANIELRKEYVRLYKQINGKTNFFVNLNTDLIENKNSKSFEKTVRDREFWLSKISIFCFIFLALLYVVICFTAGIKVEYEKILKASSVIIAVALGGVFIYSMKSFDMSLGAGTAVAAAVGGLIWNSTKNIFLVLIVGIVIGIIIELVNSTLASLLKLPVMVTTLAMSSVLSAVLTNILDTQASKTIKVTGIRELDTFLFYFLVIAILFVVFAYIFKFSPVGRKNKMIGTNAKSSQYTGINIMKQGLITFTIAGVAIGVGAMLYIVNARTVSIQSCSTIGLDVILAIVFGGMETTGGPKSKITAGIFGGLTATLITYILNALVRITGVDAISSFDSIVKGLLFLTIVTINTVGNRTKRLPVIEMMW